MDTRLKYQTLVKDILLDYAKYKPAFDDQHDSYALLDIG